MLDRDHFRFARQCGATHLVVHLEYFLKELIPVAEDAGVRIPGHTPGMTCDSPRHAGMTFAMGYIKAALEAVEKEKS